MRLIPLFAWFILLTCVVHAKESDHHLIVLPAGSVFHGDYFASGDSVEISGTVNGDVYVCAGQVIIDGIVNGDVIGLGGSFDLSGKVTRNCRLFGGQVFISGEIGNNVTVVAGNLQMLSSGIVRGGIVGIAGNIDIAASVGESATVIASNLRVSSHIQKRLQAQAGQIRLTSKAMVGGDVDYRSNAELFIDNGAIIQGKLIHHPSFVHELIKDTWVHRVLIGSKVVAFLMNFLYSFVMGILLIKVFPKNLKLALQVLNEAPWRAFSYGILVLVLLPLAALFLLMTVLGVPFALTLIAANIIGFYTAKIYSVIWASNWIFQKMVKNNQILRFFCGLILYFLLVPIPVLGVILGWSAMLLGIGAGVWGAIKPNTQA